VAYQIVAVPVALSDLQGLSPIFCQLDFEDDLEADIIKLVRVTE